MSTTITPQELTTDAIIDRVLDRSVKEHGDNWPGSPDMLWPKSNIHGTPTGRLLSNLAQDLITESRILGWGASVRSCSSSHCELHVWKSDDFPGFRNVRVSNERQIHVYLTTPSFDRSEFDGYAVVQLPDTEPGPLRDALRPTVTDLAKLLTSITST